MQIIGIAGQLGNGKDVLGLHLKEELERRFGELWHHRAWAEGLKNVFYDAFGVDKEFTEAWKRNPEIPPGFDMTVRGALQQIGDGFRQIKSDVWISWTLTRAPNKTIITDCRYVNELQRIRQEGGINVLVIRPGHVNDIAHPSESHLRLIVDFFLRTSMEGRINLSSDLTTLPSGAQYIDWVIRNDSTIQKFCDKINGGLVSFVKDRFELVEKVNDKIKLADLRLPFITKGWGYEHWIANKPLYCGKLLFFIKNRGCSWHYHKKKDETFYIESGKLLVIFSERDCMQDDKLKVAYRARGDQLPLKIYWDWISEAMECDQTAASFAILNPGDTFYVPPGMRHAMYGLEDTRMFEFSTQHFEEDSYRIHKGD